MCLTLAEAANYLLLKTYCLLLAPYYLLLTTSVDYLLGVARAGRGRNLRTTPYLPLTTYYLLPSPTICWQVEAAAHLLQLTPYPFYFRWLPTPR